MNTVDLTLVRRMQHGAAWAGIITAAVAVVALFGWILHIRALTSIAPGLATMKFNTALALVSCGTALWIKARFEPATRIDRAADALAILGAMIGLLSLVESIAGIDLRIDQLLISVREFPAPVHPGRPSEATSLCLFLLGASIALVDRITRLTQVMALLAMAIAMLAILGYAYGIQSLYRITAFSSIAIQTAVIVGVMSVGVLMVRPRRCLHQLLVSNSEGGVLARRLLPATVLLPPVIGWIRLEGQHAGLYEMEFGLAIFVLLTVVSLAAIVWWNASLLNRSDQVRRRIEADRNDLLSREQAARQRVERALVARDQILGMVSHELRTPLTPVLLIAGSMENRATTPDELEDARTIQKQIGIEIRLINQLLDLAGLTQGKIAMKAATVDLNEVARNAAGAFDESSREGGIDLRLDLCPNAGEVTGDIERLVQCVESLIDNAIKFTSAGGTVVVRTFTEGDEACVSVRDNGIGIASEAMGRIFSAFTQADPTTTRRFGGLGLGLTIAKKFAELHGGTLQAASEGNGAGATFVIRLPRSAAPADVPESNKPQDNVERKPLRILVVEDNSLTLKALAQVIRIRGHEPELAASATDALDRTSRAEFDLVIIDIGLPDMSGWELLGSLRQHSAVPAIALSGFVSDEDRHKSLECGFHSHLTKPVDIDQLMTAIRDAVSDQVVAVASTT